MARADAVPTGDVLRKLDSRWKCVIVGDASMHPAELLEAYGSIDPRITTPTQGIVWLQRLAEHFERSVWINPDDPPYWEGSHTARIIKRLFPMFQLTVDGLRGDAGAGRLAAGHRRVTQGDASPPPHDRFRRGGAPSTEEAALPAAR